MTWKRIILLAGSIAAVSIAFVGGSLAVATPFAPAPNAGNLAAKEIPDVKAAADQATYVRLSLQSGMQDVVPRATTKELPDGSSLEKSASRPSQEQLVAKKQLKESSADQVFQHAPSARKQAQTAIDNTIDALQDDKQKVFGSGVASITYDSVKVKNDNTAVATSTVHAWSHFALKDEAGIFREFTPEGDIKVTTTLSKIDGTWVITDMKLISQP